MSGKPGSGKKANLTLLRRKFHGDTAAMHRWRQAIGKKGGEESTGGGFAQMPREEVQKAGRKGGKASRRTDGGYGKNRMPLI